MTPVRLTLDVHVPDELVRRVQDSLKATLIQALVEPLNAIRRAAPTPNLTRVGQADPPIAQAAESGIREQAQNGGLIDMPAVSKLLGLAERTVWRMLSTGAIPAPLRLGTKIIRWRADEIRGWIETGCPDQKTWEKVRDMRFQGWPPKPRRPSARTCCQISASAFSCIKRTLSPAWALVKKLSTSSTASYGKNRTRCVSRTC